MVIIASLGCIAFSHLETFLSVKFLMSINYDHYYFPSSYKM